MADITILFFQRMGLFLVLVFMLTRIPSFRSVLDRKFNYKTVCYHSILFGTLGIIATQMGILLAEDRIAPHWFIFKLGQDEMLVGPSLVAIVIAGLLGGPFVGFGSGMILGLYTYFLGGDESFANSLIHPLAGILSGATARFFSEERVIAPTKAMFIGMFVPILHMGLLLIFTSTPRHSIALVDRIGLPLVITNSIAIAIFTAMIRVALFEQEQGAAVAALQALRIAEAALPYLRRGLSFETATEIAKLLQQELKLSAVSVTNREQVLAHLGLGSDHHKQGEMLKTNLSRIAVESGEIQIALNQDQIRCNHSKCPLHAAILMPLCQAGEVVGLVKMYFQRSQQLRAVDVALAQGLAKLLSNQLDVVAAEHMKALVQEAQLRNLQAQINPHFLFNTLHLISTLIRVNPDLARHIIVQLGQFMRLNLKMTSISLIPMEKELAHLWAYIEIIKVRFSDQLTIDCKVDEGTESAFIPPFTLQPIVENSLKHGLTDVSAGGVIKIMVRKKKEEIEIEICDNGKGIPVAVMDQLGMQPIQSEQGNGIGLYNVNQRLIHVLGAGSSLHIKNLPEKGCSVSFSIPILNQKERQLHEHSSDDRRR
ncbi:histidine kinase [Fodinisporobacter ferrooxydans]|uniref:histidine kinase n=1 Tax=Fodinisporobacter ferrooxydans TaxID=2901836 RepID=A0ABY4CI65_9BACL|nr:histidine kinase [Alicyclobacillaceae bacterium MYW30-H2]